MARVDDMLHLSGDGGDNGEEEAELLATLRQQVAPGQDEPGADGVRDDDG